MRYESREVTAQCHECKDICDVTLVNRRGEIYVEENTTAHPLYGNGVTLEKIVHRPGHCGGTLRVIWPRENGPIFVSRVNKDPLALIGGASANRGK
jgi:hypothetical protein